MNRLQASNFISVTFVGSGSAGMVCLWLLDVSVKNLILLVFGTIASFALSRASAATRHLVWATLLMGLILMPAATLVLPQWRALPSWLSVDSQSLAASSSTPSPTARTDDPITTAPGVNLENSADDVGPSIVEVSPALANIPLPPSSNSPWAIRVSANSFLVVWAAGVFALLAPIAVAFLRLVRLERDAKKHGRLDTRVLGQVAAVAEELNVSLPGIIVGPVGAMPMVWSFGRGRLLLPRDCDQWPKTRLNAVLSHELIHLRRRDPMLFTLGLVARALNWFNPLAWYAVHRLRIECEKACDDHVLRLGVDASEYASHLLEFSVGMRPARGTSSLAFAMATKPNIEQRIVSILDEKRSRRGVTLRRAWGLLLLVSCGVAILATLRATVANESLNTTEDDKVEIKYPYCVVEVENLQPRSLADAAKAFNLESKQSPTGAVQRPISESETLNAISKSLAQAEVAESVKAVLREIEKTKILPAKAYFRRFTRFDDEQQMHGVWWVRLFIESDDPLIYSVPIRTTHLFTRPYSQLEREQNAEQAVTLINRRSSYYEEPPQISRGESPPKDAIERIITSFKKGIADQNMEQLKSLFNWEGAALSKFAESELQMLMKAEVHSISVQPLELDGNLLHWSGFRAYHPNLPVVAHLAIEYTLKDDPQQIRKKISLELGKSGNELRLVNYVAGELKAPAVMGRISISGHTERLANGIFQVTSLTTNPGELASAHLANEEVWHRDYENRRVNSDASKNDRTDGLEGETKRPAGVDRSDSNGDVRWRVAPKDEIAQTLDRFSRFAAPWMGLMQPPTARLSSGPTKLREWKIHLVDLSNDNSLPGIELRIRLLDERQRSVQSVRATSDQNGLIYVEIPEGKPASIEVNSKEWWLVGKVLLDDSLHLNDAKNGDSSRQIKIRLSPGQAVDILDRLEPILR